MKKLVLISSVLLLGCTPDPTDTEEDSQCTIGLDAQFCFPDSHMQVVYEIENPTNKPVLLASPIPGLPKYFPDGQGEIPHHQIQLDHLDRIYFRIPDGETHRYYRSSHMEKEPPGQFAASILFTDNMLQCLTEDAFYQSVYPDEATYNLIPEETLICSEEQLISLLINYYRVTENNFGSLSEQETGRPFTLTFTDETVPFEEQEGSYRRVTYHYRVLQSQ